MWDFDCDAKRVVAEATPCTARLDASFFAHRKEKINGWCEESLFDMTKSVVSASSKKHRNTVTFESIKIPEAIKEFVSVQSGVPVCTSVQVAEKFGMEHYNLLRFIAGLIEEDELKCNKKVGALTSEGTSKEIFDCCKSQYVDDQGKMRPMYSLTKTGFLLVAMASKTEAAKKWRRKFIEAFDKLSNLVLEEANRKIMQLTKPQESIWIPVFNEFDKRIYKVLAPMGNYTEAQKLVIRKANAIVHARSIIYNAKKWEKEFLGDEAMAFMPSVHCEVDKEGNFLEVPKLSELKIGRFQKIPPEAFKRTQWSITAIKKKP